MSDGMTEAYRASRAYNEFESMINEAIVEYTLLVDETKAMPTVDLIEVLTESCPRLEIQNEKRFKQISDHGTVFYTTSIGHKEAENSPLVKYFTVSVAVNGIYRSFNSESLNEALTDAAVFVRVCNTDKGKEACEIYYDY